MHFISSERGSSVIGWVLILPVLFFFAAFGFVYFYLDQVRSCVAMAAREGAREYGIQLGQGVPNAESMARSKALKILIQEKMLPPGASFLPSGVKPPKGKKGASITLSNDGTWARCTITYYLPNFLPKAPRLFWKKETSGEEGWWPSEHFVFKVTGSAKHEYH
jgi:hypothetical protein